MHKKSLFALSIVLLAALIFPLAGDVQKAAALAPCPAAQFVADVTIPDGTYIQPGAAFSKTWRIKNIGTCAWNTGFALVFASGERMGGLSPIYLPRWVGPGQAIDLTVDLTAPTTGGTYRSYWQLQTDTGRLFGIGAGGYRNPFWVEIRVLGPTQTVVGYDFIQNMCGALWVYDGGPIPCPMNPNKRDLGYVLKFDNPTLENGQPAGAPGLLTVPQNKYNGMIQGIFTVDDILRGDHFQAIIGCQYGAVNCAVTYQLEYRKGGDNVTLWKFREQYDGLFYQVDVDLSSLANERNAQFVLAVYAAGPASGDLPLWITPRIVRNVNLPGGTVPPPGATPTDIPTLTPTQPIVVVTSTPIPPSSCTDRAQFVSDVTVPDGTTFTPFAAFTKVWRLKNVGTCTWTTGYSAAFVSGERMNAADTALPQTTLPGQTVDISVNMSAPGVAGSYRGFWELKNASGSLFGIGSTFDRPFWVDIRVAGTAVVTPTNTPGSGPTGTPTPTLPGPTSTPTNTPTPTTVPATPTPTAFASGWFLYTNSKYGFQFQL
ncbi:MAG: NBR1-Ig-like domain-containing protein, partial [Anaerolineae bacterium]